MKSALSFIFLFAMIGVTGASAQEKKTGTADTVKAAGTAKDTAVKKAPAVAVHFGKIKVTTVPETAEVSVDSVIKGSSPLTIDSLQPGAHVLIIKQKGYFGKKVTMDAAPDSTVAVNVALVKPAALVIASDPAGAKIFFDGKESGVTPYENAKVKPGDHVIRLEKERCAPFEKTITATEGKTDSLTFSLPAMKAQPAAPATPATRPAPKLGLDSTILIVLSGIFVLFGIAIFAVESGSK